MRKCRGVQSLGVAFVGFLVGNVIYLLFIIGGPVLIHPVFDIFWGPLWLYLVEFFPRQLWVYGLWWSVLLLVGCRRHRAFAVLLYVVHVVGGPLMRYLVKGDPPFYLKYWYNPVLWLYWAPMVGFAVWYFTMVFDISWRDLLVRLAGREGGAQGTKRKGEADV